MVPSQGSIYLSLTTPHLPRQTTFIEQLEGAIRESGFRPRSLGRSEWSSQAPLIPIRSLMSECSGTIVVAMARTLVTSGVDRPGGNEEKSISDRFLSTVWVQIEAAMAFQLQQPILVLREERVSAEGILDPANTGISVRSFSLEGSEAIPPQILLDVEEFSVRVKRFAG